MQDPYRQKLCELCFRYVSSLLKGLFQASSKVETSSTFYLTWTDLNNNLTYVNYYLTLQFIGMCENSCFLCWCYWEADWKVIMLLLTKFLILKVHKISDFLTVNIKKISDMELLIQYNCVLERRNPASPALIRTCWRELAVHYLAYGLADSWWFVCLTQYAVSVLVYFSSAITAHAIHILTSVLFVFLVS
jgi:hypothetical protein